MKEFGKIFSGKGSKPKRVRPVVNEPAKDSSISGSKRVMIQLNSDFWIDIASAAWKLRQKVTNPVTREPKEEMRSLVRYIDAIWESLAQVGLEIQDHTEQPFDSGQSLEVLAFQPMSGIARETVIETVKPTIYLKGVRLQRGQVIVETPQETQSESGETCLE